MKHLTRAKKELLRKQFLDSLHRYIQAIIECNEPYISHSDDKIRVSNFYESSQKVNQALKDIFDEIES